MGSAAVMAFATPSGSPSGLTLAEKSSASRPNCARYPAQSPPCTKFSMGRLPYMNLQTASRIASPMASASRLSAYIIRLARRMSSGSMGRRGSPMVGLS